MAPRKKRGNATPDAQVEQINSAINPEEVKRPAEELIAEYHLLKEHEEKQAKNFSDYIKPTRDRMEAIKMTLHAKALAEKTNGFPTDAGTAYLSVIDSYKIDPESMYKNEDRTSTGRDALLDWLLDYWDAYGSEGLQLGIAKAVVEKYIDDTKTEEQPNGLLPPGLKKETFVRMNINKA